MRRAAPLLGGLLLAIATPAGAAVLTPQVVSSFAAPGGSVKALAWGDGSLWVAAGDEVIYRLSPSGQVQGSFPFPLPFLEVSDMAWHESSLWLHASNKTYKLNSAGQIVETLNVGYWSLSGMDWAGGELYVGDYNFSEIHKHSRSGAHILSWSTGFFGHPMDMAFDGGSLWIADSCEGSSNRLWQYSLMGKAQDSIDLSTVESCSPGGSNGGRAVAWDGQFFWWANSSTVYRLSVTPALSIDDRSIVEGSSGATNAIFTVTLTQPPSSGTVTVQYQTANLTAVAGVDYTAAAGTVTFSPSQTSQTVTVAVLGDTNDESNETFRVNLSNASGATIGDGQGQGTILDDDGPSSVIYPRVVSSFPTPVGSIEALGFGDGSLWLSDENNLIYRLSTSGQMQATFPFPSAVSEVSDMGWHENSLWLHTGSKTYKLDSSAQIVETLDVGYWPYKSGMEWAEGELYVGDYNFSEVHKHSRSGAHIFSWPTLFFGHPMGMAYDGSSFWIADSSCSPNRLWQYSPTGQDRNSIDLSALEGCSQGLAWDGRYLWWASDYQVYQLDIGGDDVPPTASVVSPSGGEYWLLSDAGGPANTQVIAWTMSDNIRICQVGVSLWYSNDGGATYAQAPAGGGLPATFGSGGACTGQGVLTTSLVYTVPTTFPSGTSGSLYKVQVTATDAAGNPLPVDPGSGLNAERSGPFYIVQPNLDSVRTLIVSNTSRMQTAMGITPSQAAALDEKLQELAAHPRVQGFVADLSGVTSISDLYTAWDADPGNPDKANQVLFGCHAPLPAGCVAEKNGIHDHVRSLLDAYTSVKYVILVGDDRIIPFARIQDRTVLLPESTYPAGPDLMPLGTTVGRALAANKYLSDDPLAVVDAIRPDSLSAALYVPDLAVGRLVETPGEITTAIATFISQDGVLDLSALHPSTGHKVLVTGYDFLTDSAKQIRKRWKTVFGASQDPNSLAPVDGQLVGGNWNLGSVGARVDALEDHLSGNDGARYGVASLSGHATHYKEGVPGTDPFDIEGLAASSIAALNLAGGVVYAVGCHGGLPVAGSNPSDADHSLDLPQAFLSRGVVAYVANTGYGWGLKHGIGYGERLVQLLTEEMTKGGTIVTGDAVRKTKQRYFLETPRYDAYDEKSLMQWAFFGLPMYAVKTGLATSGGSPLPVGVDTDVKPFEGPAPRAEELPARATYQEVGLTRELAQAALPSYLTQLNLHFDFTAPGVYRKWTAEGDEIPDTPGCTNPAGCYYTLNGLVERSSGAGDLPVQPYFIYDSRLSGTSQHGVLWKGGVYDEETGWIPVVGELQSNGGDGSDHGSSPEVEMADSIAPRLVPGRDPDQCRPSDLELSSLVVGAGEAMKDQATLEYSIERRYRQIDLEVFYFNNTAAPGQNCDRTGPAIPQQAQYHSVTGSTIQFAVPASDPAGVWRVLVVVNDNTTTAGQGTWLPVELTDDGSGVWRGSRGVSSARMTYVIQAVDNRGNVSWVEYQGTALPASGVPLGVPLPVMVDTPPPGSLSINDVAVTEGNAGPTTATFTVTLSTPATETTTVQWATAPNSALAGSDYVTASGTLTFNVDESVKTVDVTVNGDTLFETNESFFVNLSAPSGGTISDSQGVGTITNDDAMPSLSIDDVSTTEGNAGTKTLTFTVTLSPASGAQATVNYATANVTAAAGSDYVASSGTLTFAAGETTKTINVTVNGDTLIEADETFHVGLSGASQAAVGDGTGVGTIANDDLPPARVFVSISGMDTNDCSNGLTPCRTLNAAISQVATDGEVIITNTGSYAGATITKGVKITAAPGIVAFSGQPITVNAGGSTVVVRGLTLKAVTPGIGSGLLIQSAGAVFVENCVVDGWDVGIRQQGAAEVFVKDSTIRNNNTGLYATTGKVSVDNTRFLSSGTGIVSQAGEVSLRGSMVAGNTVGIHADDGAAVTVDKCQIANNGTGISLPMSSLSTVRLSRSVVSGNGIGLENVGGMLEVNGTNVIRGNTSETSGTITTTGSQ